MAGLREKIWAIAIKSSFILTIMVLISSSETVLGSQDVKHYEKLRKIKLFESTVSDLEKVFKFSEKEEIAGVSGVGETHYELKNAALTVTYSLGRCGESVQRANNTYFTGYDVSRGVVVDLHLLYFDYPLISKFRLDWSSYKTEYDAASDLTSYSNDEIGIMFTGTKMSIQSIDFNPTQAQEEKYDCVKLGK